MKVEFVEFNPMTANDKEWARFHEFRRERQKEHSPEDPVIADETIRSRIKHFAEELEMRGYGIYEREKPEELAGFLLGAIHRKSSPSYDQNKHVFDVWYFELLKQYRRKKIGFQMLRKVCEDARELDKSLITCGTHEEDGKAFIRAIGAQEALSGIENRLNLDEVDWSMVGQWVSQGQDRSKNTSLEFFRAVPDEIIEEFCEVYTEVFNQAPREELKIGDYIVTPEERRKNEKNREQAGTIWLTAITKEETGAISGLTEIVYAPSQKTLAYQELTGVKEEYRGYGKGKWLKAAMLLKIREEFPEIKAILTGNATTNAPMLAINERLGFKPRREWIMAQIDLEKAEKYIQEHGPKD